MKKIVVSLALTAIAFAAQAQSMGVSLQSAAPVPSAVSNFLDQPDNCRHMLGGSNDGDLLPSSYNVALDASLREINAPVEQAFALLNARCAQRLSARQAPSVQRVTELSLAR
jgi:hypothetical protein